MLKFTTKAETLRSLEPLLKSAKILPQVNFSVGEYRADETLPKKLLDKAGLSEYHLIIRSSARNEDTSEGSNAGKFLSIGNVKGEAEINSAVKQVADAMGDDELNIIFIQPYLTNVELCGVAFTLDPNNGGNYFVINYDDTTGSTSSVTDGTGESLKTFYQFKAEDISAPEPLDKVIELCRELESLFEKRGVDLEFAVSNGELYLLQVRPLVLKCEIADIDEQKRCLKLISEKIRRSMQPHPDLCGKQTVYGVMPDWNPAEMIGIKPRPLALSLYKEIITNGVWAYQRDNYGYRNLRSFPLMLDFCGLPYIDTRVSFNSFLPKELSGELPQKLAEHYLEQLRIHPEWHDKVEFEIAFTCYTFDLPKRVKRLLSYGFTEDECGELCDALRNLTNSIISREGSPFRKDTSKIEILRYKHEEIMQSGLETEDKIYWLLEYCKRYGTLPFAGLARAGFIAVEFLRSMVSEGLLNEKERTQYMNSISTIGKMISNDFAHLNETAFMKKYGHLRPGTYDICSPRYDKSGDAYFDFSRQRETNENSEQFRLSLEQYSMLQKMLDEHKIKTDVLSLFDFIKSAIEGREYAKFIFTHTLSDVLELIARLGEEHGFSRENMSYVTIQDIIAAYSSAEDIKQVISKSIERGKASEKMSLALSLPPLILSPEQVFAFQQLDGEPNYITQKQCEAETVCLPSDNDLAGKIVLLQSADPGYDWLFSRNIAGFITAYGGANSHMAIRSAEFGLPAVIGVGEKNFARFSKAEKLHIDCLNKTVKILL